MKMNSGTHQRMHSQESDVNNYEINPFNDELFRRIALLLLIFEYKDQLKNSFFYSDEVVYLKMQIDQQDRFISLSFHRMKTCKR
jgi:hypothetical protein